MNTQDILKQLGLSVSEVAVYDAMVSGKRQAKDIMNVTGLKRPSVYYALSRLEQRGLVGRVQSGEYNQWQLGDPAMLEQIAANKAAEAKQLSNSVSELVQSISTDSASQLQTQVTFHEGQKAVEGVVFNMLYCKSKEILSIAPDRNFFQQTGSDFAMKFIAERKQRGIATKHLWESLGPATPEIMREYYGENNQVRILPKSMQGTFVSSLFIYDDSVMYVSSQLSGYAVVFKSKEHAELQRALFGEVWSNARPLS